MMLAVAQHSFGQNDSENASKSAAEAEATPQSTPEATEGTDGVWNVESPDEAFFAVARAIPDKVYLYKHYLDGVAVGIFRIEPPEEGKQGPPVVARHDFSGRLIAHIAWSPDSKFLLFTTVNSNGHSASFAPAFLFCVADKSFRTLDAAIGNVVSPDFRFEPPDIAVMEVQRSNDKPEEEVKVPLAKTLPQMPPVR